MDNVRLKFLLESERKQRIYAEARAAHTERQLRLFVAWQKEVADSRRRLLGVITRRAQA